MSKNNRPHDRTRPLRNGVERALMASTDFFHCYAQQMDLERQENVTDVDISIDCLLDLLCKARREINPEPFLTEAILGHDILSASIRSTVEEAAPPLAEIYATALPETCGARVGDVVCRAIERAFMCHYLERSEVSSKVIAGVLDTLPNGLLSDHQREEVMAHIRLTSRSLIAHSTHWLDALVETCREPDERER